MSSRDYKTKNEIYSNKIGKNSYDLNNFMQNKRLRRRLAKFMNIPKYRHHF